MFVVIKKELAESLRNKQFMLTGLLMPVFFTGMAVFQFKMLGHATSGRDAGKAASLAAGSVLMFLSLVPTISSQILAAYSFAGEKVQKTLEPLLATPLSDAELLFGKLLAAWLPGQVIGWISIAAFLVLSGWTYPSTNASDILPAPLVLLVALVLQPLVGMLPCLLTLIVSSRVSEVRAAMQWGGLGVLPIVLMLVAFSVVGMRYGILVLGVGVVLIFGANLVLFIIALALFSRERLVSKWT